MRYIKSLLNNPQPPLNSRLLLPTWFYLFLVIIVAFALRVVRLNNLPLSLSLDEATNGLDALQLWRLKWLTPFLQNNFGRETLFFYFQAAALQLYGLSFFSLRFVSTIAATLTLPLLYNVGRRLRLDEPGTLKVRYAKTFRVYDTSLLAVTGLAVSYWHIYFSHLGLRAISLLPLTLAVVWCFWRGWYSLHNRRYWLIAGGALLGLSFYTYLAARLLPLLFVTFAVIELVRDRSARRDKLVSFIFFGLTATLTAAPLALYFYQNPQAFSSRTQAISIFNQAHPWDTFVGNLGAVLQLHFWPGTWLGEWTALNALSALGLLVGLPACLYHLKKPACLFLLLWWLIGTAPVVLSQQNWPAPTVTLRGIIAWPALFLISAIGLTTLLRLAAGQLQKLGSIQVKTRALSIYTLLLTFLLLIFGSLDSAHSYFSVWAAAYNKFSDHPAYLTRYLNRQTDQLTLVPLPFYGENVVNFLLQARYPTLTNLTPDELDAKLTSTRPAVYLWPEHSSGESIWVLLAPAADGQGTAYLLPPLTLPQVEAMSRHRQASPPQEVVLDSEQEAIARVYPLAADASFLRYPPATPPQPIGADFRGDILLTGWRVEPAALKPGDTVALTLYWQAQRPIDGDYNVFIHLFDTTQGQRHGQVNTSLSGLLFDAHRWPVGLTVPDIQYFTLPAGAPEGAYRFEVGLYHGASLARLPVTVANQPAADSLILGKFHAWRQPPGPPQIPLNGLQFGEVITLRGVDVNPAPLHPGQALTYRLYWQALAPMSPNYVVFTHLLDAGGQIRAQQDTPPHQGHYPTSWWDAGETVPDPYALALPPDLPPGQYTLRVGWYEPATSQRLPLKNQPQDFVDFPNLITVQ